MSKLMRGLNVLIFLAAAAASGIVVAEDQPLATIGSLDVARYMGRWYEIAKFPNRFQRDCARDTTAEYSVNPEGGIQVVNRCVTAQREVKEAIGAARQVGESTSPKLKVRFAPAWLSFIPAVWGDYWVIDLDEKYELAAVSEPRREYLWILSRRPDVPPEIYAALLQRLRAKQLDVERLEQSRHTGMR